MDMFENPNPKLKITLLFSNSSEHKYFIMKLRSIFETNYLKSLFSETSLFGELKKHIDEPSTWWWPKAAAAKIMADPRHEPRPGGFDRGTVWSAEARGARRSPLSTRSARPSPLSTCRCGPDRCVQSLEREAR